jgi:opacity protein-like surface antigen
MRAMNSAKYAIGLLLAGTALTASSAAQAADAAVETTSTTTTTTTTPVAAPADPETTPPARAQTGMTLPGATPEPAAEATDHALVVRHFGIGYMGRRSINIDPNPGGAPITVDAPIIGVRYWLDPMIGIDAGIGILFSGGSTTVGDTSTDRQGYTVFMLHGGVPLALASSKHFSFQVIPELNFGVAGSKTVPAAGGEGADLSGIHFDIGARAGGEIQFGFIGIPELSLQAGVGLALSYDRSKITPPGGAAATSVNQTSLGTSVGNNPWNIFTSNIAALYYFR